MKKGKIIGHNLIEWLKEGWDVLCKFALWLYHGIAWVGICVVVFLSVFFIKSKSGDENDSIMTRAISSMNELPDMVYVCMYRPTIQALSL